MIWVLTEALGTSALLLLAQQCAGWDYFIEDVQAGFLAVDALVLLAVLLIVIFCFYGDYFIMLLLFFSSLFTFFQGIFSFVRTEGWHNRHPQRQHNQEV